MERILTMILFQELQEVSENSGITFDCAFDEFEVILAFIKNWRQTNELDVGIIPDAFDKTRIVELSKIVGLLMVRRRDFQESGKTCESTFLHF